MSADNIVIVKGSRAEVSRLIANMRTGNKKDPYSLNQLVPLDHRTWRWSGEDCVSEYAKHPDGSDGVILIRKFWTNESECYVSYDECGDVIPEESDPNYFSGVDEAYGKWGTRDGARDTSVSKEDGLTRIGFSMMTGHTGDVMLEAISRSYPQLVFGLFSLSEEVSLEWMMFYRGEIVERNCHNINEAPPHLRGVEQILVKDEDDPEWDWDSFYEAMNDWRDNLISSEYADFRECLDEFAVWARKSERSIASGKRVEPFCYVGK